MKKLQLFLSIMICLSGYSQVPISSYTIVDDISTQNNNTALGWNSSGTYNDGTTFSMFYGSVNSTTGAFSRRVTGFSISSGVSMGSYLPVSIEFGKPFDTVLVKRINNLRVTGRRVNSLYEIGSFDGGTNSLYLQPDYFTNMEDLINHKILNIGSDNTFSNNASTENNIERIDLIFSKGVGAASADLDKIGMLINERGGNDNFKIAAITGIGPGFTVTSLGPLIPVSSSDWGNVGPDIVTVVMSKEEADPFLRPKQDLSSQNISGVFVSLQSMGISANTLILGVSLFANDVSATDDLVGLSGFDTDTNGGSNGGLDLMAGGGFFRESSTLVLLPLKFTHFSGKVDHRNNIILNWSIATDNFEYGKFIVEKSMDGITWNSIADIPEINSGLNIQEYSFTDNQILSNRNIYRIKYINQNNKITYSNAIFIKTEIWKDKIKMYHSPGSDLFTINHNMDAGFYKIGVFDMMGRTLQSENLFLEKNTVSQHYFKTFASGMNVIRIIGKNGFVKSHKIIR